MKVEHIDPAAESVSRVIDGMLRVVRVYQFGRTTRAARIDDTLYSGRELSEAEIAMVAMVLGPDGEPKTRLR